MKEKGLEYEKDIRETKKTRYSKEQESKRLATDFTDIVEAKNKQGNQCQDAKEDLDVKSRECTKLRNKEEELRYITDVRRSEKEELEAQYKHTSADLETHRKEFEELKKSIDSKMRERDLLNKDVVD